MRAEARLEHLRELLTAAEAAEVAGLGKRTWWRYVGSGRAPQPVRFGAAVRWRRSELAAWIEAGCPRVRQEVER
jgi:excisionase family DNA binding protein